MTTALRTSELSSEMLEFVKAGTPQPQSPVALSLNVEPAKTENAAPEVRADMDAPEQQGRSVRSAKIGREHGPERVEPVSKVTLSIRVPAEIPAGLLRASTDRKLNHQHPATQQEIVAEAIYQWLKRNGY